MIVGRSAFSWPFEVWWKNRTLDLKNTGGIFVVNPLLSFYSFVWPRILRIRPRLYGVAYMFCLAVEIFEMVHDLLDLSRTLPCM